MGISNFLSSMFRTKREKIVFYPYVFLCHAFENYFFIMFDFEIWIISKPNFLSRFHQFFWSKSFQFFWKFPYFFMPGNEHSPIELWEITKKINRVPPMNFYQFWKIFQIREPNEDFPFFLNLAFLTFFYSRVWQIFVLNYEFLFQKNWNFCYFKFRIHFHGLKSKKVPDAVGKV